MHGENIEACVFVHLHVEEQFISPDLVIAELQEKARECEKRAEEAPEHEAAALREEADQCRNWAKSIGTGFWAA